MRLFHFLFTILLASLASSELDFSEESFKKKFPSHHTKPKKCERISIPLCQGVGYNMTSYPNSYGHENQEEAGLEVHQFYPLVRVNCYKHLKFFLCAMYTPICQDNYDLSVMPCQEVCLEARKYCSPLMNQYGFKWPETLTCEKLPKMNEQETTGNLCAAPPDIPDPALMDIPNKGIHVKPPTQILVVEPEETVQESTCECKCSESFSSNFISAQNSTGNKPELCTYSCYSDVIYLEQDKEFMNNWISVWSGICLVLSMVTVFSFLTDMSRFPYPERPIFFLSLCQLMVSIGFILRVFNGHTQTACNQHVLKGGIDSYTFFKDINSSNQSCLTVFFLTYFFGMAGSCWWVILALTWVLAAVPHWSTEWISKYSTYFHLFAWILPFVQTFFVLAANAVDGDPVSGICYVGNTNNMNLRMFVLGPMLVYFFVGVCFLSIGFLNLWTIRSNLKKTHPGIDKTSKLTQLMSKIGIFSVLYTVPALFIILALFYEQHYKSTSHHGAQCSSRCPQDSNQDRTNLIILMLTLVKTSSMLIVGWTSGIWILSVKTLQGWQRIICGLFCCCGTEAAKAHQNRRQGYLAVKQHAHKHLIAQQSGTSYSDPYNQAAFSMHNKRSLNEDLISSQHYHHFNPCSDIMYIGGRSNEACLSPSPYAHCQNIYNTPSTQHRTLPYPPEKV